MIDKESLSPKNNGYWEDLYNQLLDIYVEFVNKNKVKVADLQAENQKLKSIIALRDGEVKAKDAVILELQGQRSDAACAARDNLNEAFEAKAESTLRKKALEWLAYYSKENFTCKASHINAQKCPSLTTTHCDTLTKECVLCVAAYALEQAGKDGAE